MSQIQIRLLGDFDLAYDSNVVEGVDKPRLQSLLAYLLIHRDAAQSRQHLAFLFWPDSSEAQAHTNLRNLLHLLRHALPNADQFLRSDAMTLQWISSAPYALDVDEFQHVAAEAHLAHAAGDAASGERASALRTFHICATVLHRELGVGPSAETAAVFERLISTDGRQVPPPVLPRQVQGRKLRRVVFQDAGHNGDLPRHQGQVGCACQLPA